MTTYTVRMTDRGEDGRPAERTVTVEAANTAVARWKALSLYGCDAAEAVSVHNDDWGKPDEDPDAYDPLTVGKVAARLGVSRRTVYGWCEAGRFPGAWRTLGSESRHGNWRIPANEVDEVKRCRGRD